MEDKTHIVDDINGGRRNNSQRIFVQLLTVNMLSSAFSSAFMFSNRPKYASH